MAKVMMKHVVLNNGIHMPLVGLGTYKLQGTLMRSVLDAALSVGYRSIDTATVYRNEEAIGTSLLELLPKYNLQQSDVFITSKLGPKHHGYEKCLAACEQSLRALGREWIDLYLVHWPGVQGKRPDSAEQSGMRKESWRAMEQMYSEGKLKSLGVANYTVAHLDELLSYCTVKPAVLQVECHPYLIQRELRQFCTTAGIHFEAYSSLGHQSGANTLMTNSTLMSIAKRYCKSVPQILLHWAVCQNIGVIPMSTQAAHVTENFSVFDFELNPADIQSIDALDKDEHFQWNPNVVK